MNKKIDPGNDGLVMRQQFGVCQKPKNIVICSDGTGNSGGKARGTNVWSIFRGLARSAEESGDQIIEQVAIYDDGVGTERFLPLKVLSGASGYGISSNIRQLYKELVRVYCKGDNIYLFGFSRGAYTVRTLAGLICTHGILKNDSFNSSRKLDDAIKDLYRNFRKGSLRSARVAPSTHKEQQPDNSAYLHEQNSDQEANDKYQKVPIQFIGVFDTVGAIGGPFPGFAELLSIIGRINFPDYKLHPFVQKACHALSIDDARKSFEPILWEADDRVKQIWFAGVHSNVGGGYPKDQMAYVSLDWMIRESERPAVDKTGPRLYFNDSFKAMIRGEADECGQLYDSRNGFGAVYRLHPRDLKEICGDYGQNVVIHESVTHRIAMSTRDYAPAYVPMTALIEPDYKTRRTTPGTIPKTLHGEEKFLQDSLKIDRKRKRLYWLFVIYSIIVLFLFFHWMAVYMGLDQFNNFSVGGLIAIAMLYVGLILQRRDLKVKSQLTALDYWSRFRRNIGRLNSSDRRDKFWPSK